MKGPPGGPGAGAHGAGNEIHPTAIVAEDVVLGSENVIGPYAVVLGPCRLGDGNWIGPHALIGAPAGSRAQEHRRWDAPQGAGLVIGDGNVIREFASVEQGIEKASQVGSRCFLMPYSCAGHDVFLGDDVTLTNCVQVGGHARVGSGATVGLGAMIKQRTRIGGGAMVGMLAAVTRDVPPWSMAVGAPALVKGANQVGLTRSGVSREAIRILDALYGGGDWRGALPEDLPGDLADQIRAFASGDVR